MGFLDVEDIFQVKEEEFTFLRLLDEAPSEIAADLEGKNVVILPSRGDLPSTVVGTRFFQ